MSPDIDNTVLATLAGMARPGHGPITPGTRFNEDLGFDSLKLVEVVLLIEQALDITISDDAMATVHDVAGLLAAVAEARGESA
jgi:acyl carrier protein